MDLLLTPHLYSFKEQFGVVFPSDLKDMRGVLECYADIFFLAAVNAWVLDGKGAVEDFPYTRGDFHAWQVQDPKGFGKCVTFAVPALTGKTTAELAAERLAEEKAQKEGDAEPLEDVGESKKKRRSWIGRLLKRFS